MTLDDTQIPKLILLEGLSGSGKSTQAQWLEVQLGRSGRPVRWFWEGDADHPLNWFGDWRQPGYDLATYLAEPSAALDRSLSFWETFVHKAAQSDTITLLESWPFLMSVGLLASSEASDADLLHYARQVQALIQPLAPALIYLRQPDVRAALRRILDIRGESFERELFANLRRFPFCVQHGLTDFECVAQTWERMQVVVEQVLPNYTPRQLEIDITAQTYDAYRADMLDFLGLEALPEPNNRLDRFIGSYHGERSLDIRLDNRRLIADEQGRSVPLLHLRDQTFYQQGVPVTITFAGDGAALTIDSTRMAGSVQRLTRR